MMSEFVSLNATSSEVDSEVSSDVKRWAEETKKKGFIPIKIVSLVEGEFKGTYYPKEVLERDANTFTNKYIQLNHNDNDVYSRVGKIFKSEGKDGRIETYADLRDDEAKKRYRMGLLDTVSSGFLQETAMINGKKTATKLAGREVSMINFPSCTEETGVGIKQELKEADRIGDAGRVRNAFDLEMKSKTEVDKMKGQKASTTTSATTMESGTTKDDVSQARDTTKTASSSVGIEKPLFDEGKEKIKGEVDAEMQKPKKLDEEEETEEESEEIAIAPKLGKKKMAISEPEEEEEEEIEEEEEEELNSSKKVYKLGEDVVRKSHFDKIMAQLKEANKKVATLSAEMTNIKKTPTAQQLSAVTGEKFEELMQMSEDVLNAKMDSVKRIKTVANENFVHLSADYRNETEINTMENSAKWDGSNPAEMIKMSERILKPGVIIN